MLNAFISFQISLSILDKRIEEGKRFSITVEPKVLGFKGKVVSVLKDKK